MSNYKHERDALLAALKIALEALEGAQGNINPERGFADEVEAEVSGAMDAARAAIAAASASDAETYTSVSKGGSYTKLGAIRGAGSLKGLVGIAYQNEKGDLFIREPECFAKRMVLVEQGGAS